MHLRRAETRSESRSQTEQPRKNIIMSNKNNPSVTSDSPASSEVTVYSGGPALVRERREVELVEGKSEVSLAGLPEQLVPNSITITHVDGEGTFKLGPFSYRPANLSVQAILAKAIGTAVTLIEGDKSTSGKLINLVHNQAILEGGDGKLLILPLGNRYSVDPSVLAGLTSLASLVMEPSVSKAGKYGIGIMYAAEGLTWARRFEIFYDSKTEKMLRFACWIDLTNNSGAAISDTKFKLIAGHNNGYEQPNQYRSRGAKGGGARMASAQSFGLESAAAPMMADNAEVETVGEQKLYTLPDSLALANGETKQTILVLAEGVPVKSEYFLHDGYYAELTLAQAADNKLPIYVHLKVANDKKNNLGFALPSGSVNIFEPDSSGALQRTDSSNLNSHVAAGEGFTLQLGTPSKDIKATRRLTRQVVDPVVIVEENHVEEGGLEGTESSPAVTSMAPAATAKKVDKKPVVKPRYAEEDRELVIENFKDRAVEVQVTDSLPNNELQFIKEIDGAKSFKKVHSQGQYTVSVPAGGKTTVTYTIKYRIS